MNKYFHVTGLKEAGHLLPKVSGLDLPAPRSTSCQGTPKPPSGAPAPLNHVLLRFPCDHAAILLRFKSPLHLPTRLGDGQDMPGSSPDQELWDSRACPPMLQCRNASSDDFSAISQPICIMYNIFIYVHLCWASNQTARDDALVSNLWIHL